MTSGYTVRVLAAAVCSCAISAGAAEWRFAAATTVSPMPDQAAAPSLLSDKSADAQPGCGAADPCIRLWSQMSAKERAKIWPYLDSVAKTTHWREMSRQEKEDLKAHLSESERDRLRRRFSVDPSLAGAADAMLPAGQAGAASSDCLDMRRLDQDERRRMREQIMEMHRLR